MKEHDDISAAVFHDLKDEVARATKAHPLFPDTLEKGLSIVSGEAGELAQAVVKYNEDLLPIESVYAEAIQTAVVALRFANSLLDRVQTNKTTKAEIGARYIHYKMLNNTVYRVVEIARLVTEPMTEAVIYTSETKPEFTWARDRAEFEQKFRRVAD